MNDIEAAQSRRRMKALGDALTSATPSRVARVHEMLEAFDVWILPFHTPLTESKFLAPDPYRPEEKLRRYWVPKVGNLVASLHLAKTEGRLLTQEEAHDIARARIAVIFEAETYREMVVLP